VQLHRIALWVATAPRCSSRIIKARFRLRQQARIVRSRRVVRMPSAPSLQECWGTLAVHRSDAEMGRINLG
jgi:hypothetical protein